MIHISMGDLLRARAKFLPQLAEHISQGELVDVSVSHGQNPPLLDDVRGNPFIK